MIFSIAIRISGKCTTLSTAGVITKKIRSSRDVISGSIFNKQVAPAQKNDDQNQCDNTTRTLKSTRTTTTRTNDNGRAEMNFCFTKHAHHYLQDLIDCKNSIYHIRNRLISPVIMPFIKHLQQQSVHINWKYMYQLTVALPLQSLLLCNAWATKKVSLQRFSRLYTRTVQPFSVYHRHCLSKRGKSC